MCILYLTQLCRSTLTDLHEHLLRADEGGRRDSRLCRDGLGSGAAGEARLLLVVHSTSAPQPYSEGASPKYPRALRLCRFCTPLVGPGRSHGRAPLQGPSGQSSVRWGVGGHGTSASSHHAPHGAGDCGMGGRRGQTPASHSDSWGQRDGPWASTAQPQHRSRGSGPFTNSYQGVQCTL